MNEYTIFEKNVVISKAAIRYYKMQYAAVGAVQIIENRFREWYDSCGSIKVVLREYPQEVINLCISLAAEALYNSLVGIGVYDQGREEYFNQCVDVTEPDEAYNAIAEQYNAICGDRDDAFAYRKARRQARPRVGIMATDIYSMYGAALDAGVINLTTGAIHGVRNVIGNIGSSISAAVNIRKLYENEGTYNVLLSGIISCVLTCFSEHMAVVNEAKAEDYYRNDFDISKANALFESAQRVPEKEQELLLVSFQKCPWNHALYEYIFIHYLEERKNIIEIGKKFNVDFSDVIKAACYAEYDENARASQEKAERAKEKIKTMLAEYGIDDEEITAFVDLIDYDCLTRIGAEYETASLELRSHIVDKFNAYDAKEDIKAIVVKERRIWEIAKKYNVIFEADEIEETISAFCNRFSQSLGYEDTIAKAQKIMESLGVIESKTLDDFERCIISEHGEAYAQTPIGKADAIVAKIDQCKISDKIKQQYIYENDIWELFDKYGVGLSEKSRIDILYRLCEKAETLSGLTFAEAIEQLTSVVDILRSLAGGCPTFDYEKKDIYILEQIAKKIRPAFVDANLYGSSKTKYTNYGVIFTTEKEREDTLWVYGDGNFTALLDELVAALPEKISAAASEEIVLAYSYRIDSNARRFFFITTESVYGFKDGGNYHGADIGKVTEVSNNGVLGIKNDNYLIDVFSADDGRSTAECKQIAGAFNSAISQVIHSLQEKEGKKGKLKKFYDKCPWEESDECDSTSADENEIIHSGRAETVTEVSPRVPSEACQPEGTSEKGSSGIIEKDRPCAEELECTKPQEDATNTPSILDMRQKDATNSKSDDWLVQDLGLFQKGISNMTDDELNRAIVALTVKHNTIRYFAVGSEKFNKKIAKAKAAYAPFKPDERLLLMEDHTVFESAKEGFVLTDKTMYIKASFEKKKSIPLSAIRGTTIERGSGLTYVCVVTGEGKHKFSYRSSEKEAACCESLMCELLQVCRIGNQELLSTKLGTATTNEGAQNTKHLMSDAWVCECGNSNNGNFCSHCGKKRALPETWLCSCGNENKGKFCSECGTPKPDNYS